MSEEVDTIWSVAACDPRDDVHISLPDGRRLCGALNAPLRVFLAAAGPFPAPIVAALVDGQLHELSEPVTRDVSVTFIGTDTGLGHRICQSSLVLLLVAAAHELFPDLSLTVAHSVTYGGLYCRVLDGPSIDEESLERLEYCMRQLVAEDAPIERHVLTVTEARAWAEARDNQSLAQLFQREVRHHVRVYRMSGTEVWFNEHIVPSAGFLKLFELWRYNPDGFVLQIPPPSSPNRLSPVKRNPKLAKVFKEYSRSLDLLGTDDVGMLSLALTASRARETILVAEALHQQVIAALAETIANQPESVRLILIAGPSSSGKTTFSRRLTVQLLAKGLRPYPIGLDDYFVRREDTPRDSEGKYDFESLHAIDLAYFNEQLLQLMEGERVTLPRYSFQHGEREEGPTVQLGSDHVLLVEGIHGLNPSLVSAIPSRHVFRIYVSALTQLKLDDLNRVPTTDTRLVRRIVRDARERGYNASQTIARWQSVRRGEEKHIFPYQEHAKEMFNSALVYELAVLKPLAEPLLRQVEPGTAEHVEAQRLLHFLEWFPSCTKELVPEDSILREFTGGSVFAVYSPHLPLA